MQEWPDLRTLRGYWCILLALLTSACAGSDSPTGADGDQTSFTRLQSQVLEPSCAFSACHAPGNSSGSNLVLTGSGVHGALVNAQPTNANARADGLRRVVPGKPDSSLLWHKVNGHVASHHARDYGAAMPSAGAALSAGQLEYIRQWIASGANATGDAIDPKLLVATNAAASYAPLQVPTNGYQIKLSPFSISSGKEREIFVYTPVGNTQDVYVNRIQTQMRTGSHHFVLYTFAANTPSLLMPPSGSVRDLKDANGTYQLTTLAAMGYHVFFAGAQTSSSDYTFPPGVAIKLAPSASIDVNAHYVNTTGSVINGEGEANLYTVPASQVQFEAKALNLINTDLTIPVGRDTTITKTFRFNSTTRVAMLTSHMHKRGMKFVIRIAGGPRNGEVVYQSTAWDHPPIVNFPTPLVLQAGEGLTSEVTYRGDASRIVRFGLTADDEMDIIFGYWY
jgi:hypothetical protein